MCASFFTPPPLEPSSLSLSLPLLFRPRSPSLYRTQPTERCFLHMRWGRRRRGEIGGRAKAAAAIGTQRRRSGFVSLSQRKCFLQRWPLVCSDSHRVRIIHGEQTQKKGKPLWDSRITIQTRILSSRRCRYNLGRGKLQTARLRYNTEGTEGGRGFMSDRKKMREMASSNSQPTISHGWGLEERPGEV